MRSGGTVFETATNLTSSGRRPTRRHASAIRSCTRAMLSFRSIINSYQSSVLLRKFRSGRDAGFERDLVTEIFQALDVIPGQAFGLETVEEVSAQVFVGRAIFEHMVENHQHRVPHRDQSPLPAPASCQ